MGRFCHLVPKRRSTAQAMRVDELDRLVSQEFGDRSREIVEAYRCNYPEATPFDLYATIAAACVRRPAFEQASRKAALRAAPAYSYIYTWRTPVLNGRPGSFHASEIAFTFDNAEICDHYSCGVPEAFVLSKQISNAWANFARTGNPGHSGLPRWHAYRLEGRAKMALRAPCLVQQGAKQAAL